MRHYAASSFWFHHRALPIEIQTLADQAFERLKRDQYHPSLHFKKVRRYWSARVGRSYRALAVEAPGGFVWIWIGTHAEYDRLLRGA